MSGPVRLRTNKNPFIMVSGHVSRVRCLSSGRESQVYELLESLSEWKCILRSVHFLESLKTGYLPAWYLRLPNAERQCVACTWCTRHTRCRRCHQPAATNGALAAPARTAAGKTDFARITASGFELCMSVAWSYQQLKCVVVFIGSLEAWTDIY